jgi:hypothetical protein
MGLGASPHPIPNLPSDDSTIVRNISSIFNVGNLDLFDGSMTIRLVPIHHDVVCLDICTMSFSCNAAMPLRESRIIRFIGGSGISLWAKESRWSLKYLCANMDCSGIASSATRT